MPVDALPAAFSVPSQVETIGALAGLAAILGLAVLSMLYFAQARELKRLREWAGRAPERAAEVHERAMTAVPRRVTPQPMPTRTVPSGQLPTTQARPPGQAAPAPKPSTPGAPAAPATPAAPGTGKPATAAATAAAAAGTATPGAPTAPANGQTGTPGAPATPGEAKSAEAGEPAKPPQSPAGGKPALDETTIGPPPATDDDDTGDQPTTAQPAPRPAVPQPRPLPASARPATAQGQRPRTAQPLRSTSPSATIPPRGGGRTAPLSGGDGPGRGVRIALVVIAIVLVLAAGVFAFTQLTGDDDGGKPAGATTPQQTNTIQGAGGSKTTETDQATQPKGETTVAVLNGTTVPGLARAVADKLENAGYKIGNVTNAPDQQRAATQVAYQQGQERTARQVARTIDVGADAVGPVDEVTEATAGSAAVVVVTVGADQSP